MNFVQIVFISFSFLALSSSTCSAPFFNSAQPKPAFSTAFVILSKPILVSSIYTDIFSVVRFTVTLSTPSILETTFSILAEQAAQVIPDIFRVSLFTKNASLFIF